MLAKSSLILLALAIAAAGQAKLPRFEDYPAREVFKGKPATPEPDDFFRFAVEDAVAEGVTFAGRYAVARRSCGSNCESVLIVDLKTGQIHSTPFGLLSCAVIDRFQDLPPEKATGSCIDFQMNSRLLIGRGCRDDENKECGSYYYEWTGARFRLLRKLALKPQP